MAYQKLSPKAKGCMYVAEGIGTLITSSIILIINHLVWLPKQISLGSYISYGIIILLIIRTIIGPTIRYHRYSYLINEECIDVKEGYFFMERNIVPIERLHKIKMERGPIDHLFGLTKVVVTTAGGDVTIRFLEEQVAEQIADRLRKKINTIALEEKVKTQMFHQEVANGTKEI